MDFLHASLVNPQIYISSSIFSLHIFQVFMLCGLYFLFYNSIELGKCLFLFIAGGAQVKVN